MTTVRIYQPSQNVRQSGMRAPKGWLLTFTPEDPLAFSAPMGWLSSCDMTQELHLLFPSLGKAIEYARLHNLSYTVSVSSKKEIHPKSYGAAFLCPRLRR